MRGGGRTVRVDLHAHTWFSPDSVTSPAVLVERALEAGLDRIAVTDHGEIDGALEARSLAPELVIVGEEIRCACRTELIGLFLEERVPQGLSLGETVERIRDQDGVVYAPHPFAYLTRTWSRARRTFAVADVVEAYNSRAFWTPWNRRALRTAEENDIPVGAGSDAHFPEEIGQAYAEMPRFRGVSEFRRAIPEGRPVGVGLSHPGVHVVSAGLKAVRMLGHGPGLTPDRGIPEWPLPAYAHQAYRLDQDAAGGR